MILLRKNKRNKESKMYKRELKNNTLKAVCQNVYNYKNKYIKKSTNNLWKNKKRSLNEDILFIQKLRMKFQILKKCIKIYNQMRNKAHKEFKVPLIICFKSKKKTQFKCCIRKPRQILIKKIKSFSISLL